MGDHRGEIGAQRTVRFGILTDIHSGPNFDTRRGEAAEELLSHAVAAMAEAGVEFVVDLGDRINDTGDTARDRAELVRVKGIIDQLKCPVYHVYGNHDVVTLSKEEQNDLLGKQAAYEAIQLDGMALVLLDSTDIVVDRIGGALGEEQLAWLNDQLSRLQGDIFVFSHHPLAQQDVDRHGYFGRHQHQAFVENWLAVDEALRGQPRVRARFNGHLHWTYTAHVSGQLHYTLPSLVDTWLTGEPTGAYTIVDVAPDALRVYVKGRNG